ncbi:hypothetical protein [Stackebrandtia soli]|uniref:hypothetical protein n=1 Tax=Stackebrandtia soli TaxID=1892856 RepID=UPI0039EBBC40
MSSKTPVGAPPGNRPGRLSLVAGFVALGFAVVPIIGDFVALTAAVLAIALGIVGMGRVDDGRATNPGQCVAGVVLGGFAGLIAFIFIAASFN